MFILKKLFRIKWKLSNNLTQKSLHENLSPFLPFEERLKSGGRHLGGDRHHRQTLYGPKLEKSLQEPPERQRVRAVDVSVAD